MEEKARAYLRYELWRIRKALSKYSTFSYILADNISVCFNPESDYWLDVTRIKNLTESASVTEFMDALSLYRGELLPGFYDEWITQEREHLQAEYDRHIARLLEILESKKDWNAILNWAEPWISSDSAPPEAAFRYLMIAYSALGDRAKVKSTYERCIQALHKLNLEPSARTRALAFEHTPKLNIPIPLTSFIGREKELKEVAELLSKSRFVTLTGSGGVGKTRLAIQVVADSIERFPDGIWFLDLAPLTEPALVPSTLASLIGLREFGELPINDLDLLINYFQRRGGLVIIDNCEHLIESCAQLVHSLLSSCENLSIFATSRESLRVAGEITYRVPSLVVPKTDMSFALDEALNAESMQLFKERAEIAMPGFVINAQNGPLIVQICRRLNGIPLAIELAAARVNVLSVDQIAKRLDDRFNLLTIGSRSALPRHQTLRATIEWSYDLLSERECILFRRLAVFMGGWTLESAEEVCGGNGLKSHEILDLLTQLVNKSLVWVESNAVEHRYRRLETIRQFAREKLLDTGEVTLLRNKHLAYFLKKAEEIEPYLTGAEQSTWMNYLDQELDNIRLALDWCISEDKSNEYFRLFGSLTWFCYIHCHCREGLKWFRRALKFKKRASKNAQAKAVGGAGWLNYAIDDLAAASTCHRQSANLYRELGDTKGLSTQLQFAGVLEFQRGNRDQARIFLEESLLISRTINNKLAMPRVIMHLGHFAQDDGDYTTAWRYYEESLAICRELQEGHLTMMVLSTMGDLALTQKKYPQARQYFKEALEIGVRLKNKRTMAETFLRFAEILSFEERYAECAHLLGFAETLFEESESLTESHLEEMNRISVNPTSKMGENAYQREFDNGKILKLDQAVEIACKSK
jgi:predicted ATPase/DNA-binding SARP family transcriptional activator